MPFRILGKGRDAYLLAGYLDKKSRWSSWSERYYVLTPNTLYCFKKDRQQLYGDLRAKAPVESMSVKQLKKQPWCFEMTVYDPESNSSKARVLRASSEQECLIWIKAIEDAKRNITDRKHNISSVSISDPTFQPMDRTGDRAVAKQLITSALIQGTSSHVAASSSSAAPAVNVSSASAVESTPSAVQPRKRLDSLPLLHQNQILPSRSRPSLDDPLAAQLDSTHSPHYDLVNSALPLHHSFSRSPVPGRNPPSTSTSKPCLLVALTSPSRPAPYPALLSDAYSLVGVHIPWGQTVATKMPEACLSLFHFLHLILISRARSTLPIALRCFRDFADFGTSVRTPERCQRARWSVFHSIESSSHISSKIPITISACQPSWWVTRQRSKLSTQLDVLFAALL